MPQASGTAGLPGRGQLPVVNTCPPQPEGAPQGYRQGAWPHQPPAAQGGLPDTVPQVGLTASATTQCTPESSGQTPAEPGFPPEWPGARTSTLGPRWELASHPCFLSPLVSNWLPTSILLCPNFLTPDCQSSDPGAGWGPGMPPPVFSVPGPPGMGRSRPESQPPLVSSCPECEVFPHLG